MTTATSKKRNEKLTAAPLEIPPRIVAADIQPEFIRLPNPGQRCPYTGMSRSALNALILATPLNGNKPAVVSFVLRQRGAKTGIRLIDYESLVGYIRQHPEGAAQ